MGLQPPTPEQRAQALANIAAAEAAQQSLPPSPGTPAAPAASAQSAAAQAAPNASNRKATLLGVAPEAIAPKASTAQTNPSSLPASPSPVHAAEPKPAATTQVGFAAPAPVLPNGYLGGAEGVSPSAAAVSPAPNVARALNAPVDPNVGQRLATSADAPTPIEVPIGNADSSRGRIADEDGKPTGVAKAYHPKSVNAPPVVVDQAALQAGQAAAQAEHAALAAKRRRNINAITIPGTVRVVPRGAGLTPDIEPIDMAALKPSRKPLLIGVLLVLLGGGAAAAFVLSGSSHSEPTPPSVRAEATPKPEPMPAGASSSVEPPAPADATPTPSQPTAGSDSSSSDSASSDSGAQASPPASEASAKTAATRRPTAPAPAKATPAKKTPVAASPKPRTTTQPATPSKGKGVIVRDSPF